MDLRVLLEEKLREAACFGDAEAAETLINKGVDINSKNRINGWTAIHWASKRNHEHIVRILMNNGADVNILGNNGESAVLLTANPNIVAMLKGAPDSTPCGVHSQSTGSNLFSKLAPRNHANDDSPNSEFMPSYLSNPPLNYKVDLAVPFSDTGKSHRYDANGRNFLGCENGSASGTSYTHSLKAGIPLSTSDELILKIRVAGTSCTDFIEIDIPRDKPLTYSELVETCCEELGVDVQHFERLRKLPNTVLRRDKDVQRLVDYQELEVVVSAIGMSSTENRRAFGFVDGFRRQTILY